MRSNPNSILGRVYAWYTKTVKKRQLLVIIQNDGRIYLERGLSLEPCDIYFAKNERGEIRYFFHECSFVAFITSNPGWYKVKKEHFKKEPVIFYNTRSLYTIDPDKFNRVEFL